MTKKTEMCFYCTKELDDDGDCFECGSGKYVRDCACIENDYLCPDHQKNENCTGPKYDDEYWAKILLEMEC